MGARERERDSREGTYIDVGVPNGSLVVARPLGARSLLRRSLCDQRERAAGGQVHSTMRGEADTRNHSLPIDSCRKYPRAFEARTILKAARSWRARDSASPLSVSLAPSVARASLVLSAPVTSLLHYTCVIQATGESCPAYEQLSITIRIMVNIMVFQ